MNLLAKAILLASLSTSSGGSAQGVGVVTTVSPSSVDEFAPLVLPLAGTLFVDQRERERMNDARRRGDFSNPGASSIAVTPSILDGFVKRSDGKTIIWVDGKQRLTGDVNLISRVQPASVGMETSTVITRDPGREVISNEPARATTPGKSRKAVRKSDSAASPPGK